MLMVEVPAAPPPPTSSEPLGALVNFSRTPEASEVELNTSALPGCRDRALNVAAELMPSKLRVFAASARVPAVSLVLNCRYPPLSAIDPASGKALNDEEITAAP